MPTKLSASRKPPPAVGSPRWHKSLAERMALVRGGAGVGEVAQATGTNFETVRRYLITGRVPARFAAALCVAYGIDPRWLLFGKGRMRA